MRWNMPAASCKVPEMSRVAELLEGSSRTFALSIPMLPEPLRSEIGVA